MHVAIIMDGNRRWAAARGVPAAQGHRAGERALDAAVRAALDLGIESLTVFAFSTENWRRAAAEVAALMQLCASFARSQRETLLRGGVRVRVCGDLGAFSFPARAALERLERDTAHHSRLTLTLALNYSGRAEIVRAARLLAARAARGEIRPEDIDEARVRESLYVPELPDPDLLIRTGGELRISNFLLYQLAYTELISLPVLWPDFTGAHLQAALGDFGSRERRYGA
jgi:undecaprenyl diphosphate synthase